MKVKRLTSTRKNERGSILATSALGMLAVLFAVGLGVDISRFYLAKNELQNAADAAALAAVSALDGSATGISKAADRAVDNMNNSYDFNKTGVSFPRTNILFGVNLEGQYVDEGTARGQAANIRFVQVTSALAPIDVSFAAAVIGNSKNLSATATAGFSVPLNVFCNWLPVSVIDYDVPIMVGQTYTFRAAPSDGPSPGNYQILAAAGRGGSDVRTGLGQGVNLCASPGDVYEIDTKPGMTSGPVRQGLNTRFDEYSGGQVDPISMPPDKNITEGIDHNNYLNNPPQQTPSHDGVEGRRVVIIPIVKLAEYDQGRNTVKFDRFGQFFLKNKVGNGNGGELIAEYIDDIVLAGDGGFNPNGAPGNPLTAVPVLYK
jgi:Putative Flp pilus-assembly TadE/G-like